MVIEIYGFFGINGLCFLSSDFYFACEKGYKFVKGPKHSRIIKHDSFTKHSHEGDIIIASTEKTICFK